MNYTVTGDMVVNTYSNAVMNSTSHNSIMINTSFNSTVSNTSIATHEYGDSDCSDNYLECVASRYLYIIFSPILLILGTTGNLLVLIVMMKKPLRNTSFGCYLAAISITDTLAIWTALTRHFIKHALSDHRDIRDDHEAICWLQRFLLYGSLDSSVWLLVAVTIERTLSIYRPTSSSIFKSLGRTRAIILSICIVQYGWNIFVFFTRGEAVIEDDAGVMKIIQCGYSSKNSQRYWKTVHPYVAVLVYSLLPFIIMLTLNIAIIKRLKRRDRAYETCASVSYHNHNKVNEPGTRRSHVSSKTLMLLPVSIFFLVTTLPSLIFTGIEVNTQTEGVGRARMELLDTLFTLLLYLNHSMNFVLYCMSGKIFRKRCWTLIVACFKGHTDQAELTGFESRYSRSPARSPLTIRSNNWQSTLNNHQQELSSLTRTNGHLQVPRIGKMSEIRLPSIDLKATSN